MRCYLVRITKSEILTEDSSPSLMTPFHVQLYLKGSIIKMVSRQNLILAIIGFMITKKFKQRPCCILGLRVCLASLER